MTMARGSPLACSRTPVQDYVHGSFSMSELCRRYDISRKTGYKWIGRFEQEGRAGLTDLPDHSHSGESSMQLQLAARAAVLVTCISAPAPALVTIDEPLEYVMVPTSNDSLENLRRSVVHLRFPPGSPHAYCTGTLLAGTSSILTGAHCVTDAQGDPAVASVEVEFLAEDDQGQPFPSMTATDIDVHKQWTGNFHTSPADLALIHLPAPPPAGAGLFVGPDVTGMYDLPVEVLGTGDAGMGGVDPALQPGRLRIGWNHYDDPAGLVNNPAGYHYMDFDLSEDGNVIGEAGCIPYQGGCAAAVVDVDLDGENIVRGESLPAPGDSGGPSVLDRYFVVGIHSFATRAVAGDTLPAEALGDSGAIDFGSGTIVGDVDVV